MLRAASRNWLWRTVVVIGLALALRPSAEAAPAASKDARRAYEEATAAFGLGRYAEAAERYEAAFALRPDPALLYNAAQSYRLAGNKARALELYRNYVRLYPDGANAEDARSHVAALKKVIEDERPPIEMARPPAGAAPAPGKASAAGVAPPPAGAPSPQAGAAPPPAARPMPPPVETPMPVTPLPAAAPPPAADPDLSLVARPAPGANEKKSLTQQTWFWVAIGAGAAIVATTVILLATRSEKFPDATFGTARGN